MKFRAHDTFFIRKGWLSKGMKNVVAASDVFISKEENPMDVLGIGANMVKALRYWMQAVGLTSEPTHGKRVQSPTPLGTAVYQNDRYIEELGTLCLLHYNLATNRVEATAWYYFFNEFSMTEFTREDFVASLQNWIQMQNDGEPVAIRSLNDDFNCIINTYVPRYKTNPSKVSAENNIDCPLGELGLIDLLNKQSKTYKKTIPSIKNVSPWVFLAIITMQAAGRAEVSLNELLTSPNSIGKVFNLDSISMLDILYGIERINMIKIIRTAGLDVVRFANPELTFQACIDEYYKSLA